MKITIRKSREKTGIRWILDYTPIGGKRVRRFFKTKPEADAAAQDQRQLARKAGESWLALSASERADIVTSYERIRDLQVDLKTVIDQWLAGSSQNGNGAPVAKSLTLGKAGDLWEQFMLRKGNSQMHAANARRWVCRFAAGREEMEVCKVTTDDIIGYLSNYKATTYNGNRDSARSFFGWAFDEGFHTQNIFDGKRMPKQKIIRDGACILTAEQTRKAMGFCHQHKDLLAYVSIAIFCGIRPKEIDRMTWDMIDLEHGLIHLPAHITKTRRPRLVHLHDTAKAWIQLAKDKGSPLGAAFAKGKQVALVPLRNHLGYDAWPSDIMRHSFGSYTVARTRNVAETALEMGNSPDIIMTHYFNTVKPAECKAFWAVTPRTIKAKKS